MTSPTWFEGDTGVCTEVDSVLRRLFPLHGGVPLLSSGVLLALCQKPMFLSEEPARIFLSKSLGVLESIAALKFWTAGYLEGYIIVLSSC